MANGGSPGGIIADCFLTDMHELTLVLENLRSCHNVGSIIRSAEGFGRLQFIFIGTTPYPEIENDRRLKYQILRQTKQIGKTALGAEQKIKGRYFKDVAEFLEQAEDNDLICLEQTPKSLNLADYRLKNNSYLIVGNEIDGVCDQVIKKSTTCLMIPMVGKKESFNVAVAAGIALYHFDLN